MFGLEGGAADIVIPTLYRNHLFLSGQAVDFSVSRRKESVENTKESPLMHTMLIQITGEGLSRAHYPKFSPGIAKHLHAFKSDTSASETLDDIFMLTCTPTTMLLFPHPRMRKEFRGISSPKAMVDSGLAIRSIVDRHLHDLVINIWAANKPIQNKPRSYMIGAFS